MGLVVALLTWLCNKGEESRVGRFINTTIATIICIWAFLVALAITNAIIFHALGI